MKTYPGIVAELPCCREGHTEQYRHTLRRAAARMLPQAARQFSPQRSTKTLPAGDVGSIAGVMIARAQHRRPGYPCQAQNKSPENQAAAGDRQPRRMRVPATQFFVPRLAPYLPSSACSASRTTSSSFCERYFATLSPRKLRASLALYSVSRSTRNVVCTMSLSAIVKLPPTRDQDEEGAYHSSYHDTNILKYQLRVNTY